MFSFDNVYRRKEIIRSEYCKSFKPILTSLEIDFPMKKNKISYQASCVVLT